VVGWRQQEIRPLRRFALALTLSIAVLGPSSVAEAGGGARDYIVRYRDGAVAGGSTSVQVASSSAVSSRPATFRVARVNRRKVNDRVRRARAMGVRPRHVFRDGLGGFSARLTPGQVRRLQDDPSVASVEVDWPVEVVDRVESGVRSRGEFGSQQVPTGIRRIYADKQPLAHIGDRTNVDADIAVLDTGVDGDHPDLNVRSGIDCSDAPGGSTQDRYGHGTHVAGTIAARDNDRGVVGVVPGARIWSVKVLGDDGTGTTSDIVCGLDWMISRQLSADGPRFIAANMSLAGPQRFAVTPCGVGTADTYHLAMCQAMDAGIVFAVAAANDSRVVNQRPAIYDEPITAAALADYDGRPGGRGRQREVCPWYSADSDDTWANFSNWGRAVDILAPGKCILSTFKGGRYAWMSGTSMATPHVAGAIALYRLRYPAAMPQQVKQALVSAGTRDWRTSSAPDGRAYRMLQVRSFTPPPTFVISSIVSPSTPLGGADTARGVRITISRRDGHYRPVKISVSGPASVDSQTLRIADHGRRGTLVLLGTSALRTGTVEVEVRASDGEVTSRRTVRVPVDADPPVVDIQAPTGGTIIQSSDTRTVRATSSDERTGVSKRSLQRRRAPQSGPMSCEDVTWANDGGARTVSGSGPWTSTGLRSGFCYRWVVAATDRAGNVTRQQTAVVWTDVSKPEVPSLEATGDAVARGTTVWFRAGTSGRFTLDATARDPHSGVVSASLAGVSGTGWSTTSSSTVVARQSLTATARRSFAFTSRSGSSSVSVRATNGLDLTRSTAVSFRPDGSAPSVGVISPSRLTWLGSSSARIRYSASDGGSGLASVTARRQRTTLRSRAEGCASAWMDDGSPAPVSGGSFTVDGLEHGYCYRWVFTARDRVGHQRSRPTAAVAIDPTRPVVDQVRVAIARQIVGTGGSIPVRLTWRLRTAPVGDTSFTLARTTNGGAGWATIPHPKAGGRSEVTNLGSGTATTVSVRGRSTTGSVSGWAVSRRVTARLVQEDATGVTRSRGWTRVALDRASGGYRLVSSRRGARVSYRFTGDSIAVVGSRDRSMGTAVIRIDGRKVATVSLRSSAAAARRIVWAGRVSPGRHTITVAIERGKVVVDGFVVTTSAAGDRR
jgi:subtilisin family serine protease